MGPHIVPVVNTVMKEVEVEVIGETVVSVDNAVSVWVVVNVAGGGTIFLLRYEKSTKDSKQCGSAGR